MLCIIASLYLCPPTSLLPSLDLLSGRSDYLEEIKYFYIKLYYNKYCQMLFLSFVPSLSVKRKHLKLHSRSRPCDECTHRLWVTALLPLPLCLTLWFMPRSQLPCPKAESSSNNKNAGSQSGTLSLSSVLPRGLSGVWELDIIIFICLYPNFLLWGNETSE